MSPPPPSAGSTVYEWTAVTLMMVAVFSLSTLTLCCLWRCWREKGTGKHAKAKTGGAGADEEMAVGLRHSGVEVQVEQEEEMEQHDTL